MYRAQWNCTYFGPVKPTYPDSNARNSDFIGLESGPSVGIILKLSKYFSYAVMIMNPHCSSGIIKFKSYLQLQLTRTYKLISNSITQNPHWETFLAYPG